MSSFYERPILNSPYRAPELHHPLDENGQPLEGEPVGRLANVLVSEAAAAVKSLIVTGCEDDRRLPARQA